METLSNYFSSKFRVYYEDTDSGGVMYYANFLKFAERGRTEALRTIDVSQQDLSEKQGLFFIVKSCYINFIKPAKLDDTILVKTVFKKVQQTSILILQYLYSDGFLLAELEVVVVCVKKKDELSFSPAKIPLEISSKLRQNNKQSSIQKSKE
jgi:acyl-CoA thioester hydrolase